MLLVLGLLLTTAGGNKSILRLLRLLTFETFETSPYYSRWISIYFEANIQNYVEDYVV